jgi:hypothetical protein
MDPTINAAPAPRRRLCLRGIGWVAVDKSSAIPMSTDDRRNGRRAGEVLECQRGPARSSVGSMPVNARNSAPRNSNKPRTRLTRCGCAFAAGRAHGCVASLPAFPFARRGAGLVDLSPLRDGLFRAGRFVAARSLVGVWRPVAFTLHLHRPREGGARGLNLHHHRQYHRPTPGALVLPVVRASS